MSMKQTLYFCSSSLESQAGVIYHHTGKGDIDVVFAAVLGHKGIEVNDGWLPGTKWAEKYEPSYASR